MKEKPERWQDNSDEKEFDVVVCFEERVFDGCWRICERRTPGTPCLVINLDVRDSHEDAVNGADGAEAVRNDREVRRLGVRNR